VSLDEDVTASNINLTFERSAELALRLHQSSLVGALDVRYALDGDQVLHRSEMSRCTNSGQHPD